MNTPASNAVHELSPCSWLFNHGTARTTTTNILSFFELVVPPPLGRPSYFLPLVDSPHDPFRDGDPVASFTRETSASSSQILKVFRPPSQDFFLVIALIPFPR